MVTEVEVLTNELNEAQRERAAAEEREAALKARAEEAESQRAKHPKLTRTTGKGSGKGSAYPVDYEQCMLAMAATGTS